MSKWKKITGLSAQDTKAREAAFEAQLLATIAPVKLQPPVAPMAQPPAIAAGDGIQIVVTENGQTNFYSDLANVPPSVRQRILNVWRPAPPVIHAPTIRPEPPARPHTQRFAHGLNLMLPGAGHYYLGHRLAGGLYATGFIASFVAAIAIFVRAYGEYLRLSTGGDILDANNLERLTAAFPAGALIGLMVVGILIYVASAIHLSRLRPRD
jgi:hypothetical protein